VKTFNFGRANNRRNIVFVEVCTKFAGDRLKIEPVESHPSKTEVRLKNEPPTQYGVVKVRSYWRNTVTTSS